MLDRHSNRGHRPVLTTSAWIQFLLYRVSEILVPQDLRSKESPRNSEIAHFLLENLKTTCIDVDIDHMRKHERQRPNIAERKLSNTDKPEVPFTILIPLHSIPFINMIAQSKDCIVVARKNKRPRKLRTRRRARTKRKNKPLRLIKLLQRIRDRQRHVAILMVVPSAAPASSAPMQGPSTSDVARMTVAEHQTNKKAFKQQLKQYDTNFVRKHGCMPVKAEKEPIRHLYQGYKILKARIRLAEKEGRHLQSPPVLLLSTSPLQKRAVFPSDSLRNDTTGGEAVLGSLRLLRADSGQLHHMLRSYEKEFYKKNKRAVSSYADIQPVASQYLRYKEINKAIAALHPE
jgi:hypothetical protein